MYVRYLFVGCVRARCLVTERYSGFIGSFLPQIVFYCFGNKVLVSIRRLVCSVVLCDTVLLPTALLYVPCLFGVNITDTHHEGSPVISSAVSGKAPSKRRHL